MPNKLQTTSGELNHRMVSLAETDQSPSS